MDSGAYSAFTQGKRVSFPGYVRAARAVLKGPSTRAFSLDVINDPRASWRNWQELRRRGVDTIPVVHSSSSVDWVARYIDAGASTVALGGLVNATRQVSREELRRWLDACFALDARFHGFGLTAWKMVRRWPWLSVDSSTWACGPRFGRLVLYDPDRDSFVTARSDRRYSPRVVELMLRWYRPPRLDDRARYLWIGATSWHHAAQATDTKIYLADSTLQNLHIATEALRHHDSIC
jgi:hypothetical protein